MVKHRGWQRESCAASHLPWFYNPWPAQTGAASSTRSHGDAPGLPLQHRPRRYLPGWSINNRNTFFTTLPAECAVLRAAAAVFSETATQPPSSGQPAYSPANRPQCKVCVPRAAGSQPAPGQRGQSLCSGPGEVEFPQDRTPWAAGSRPPSPSSGKKTGSPPSAALTLVTMVTVGCPDDGSWTMGTWGWDIPATGFLQDPGKLDALVLIFVW